MINEPPPNRQLLVRWERGLVLECQFCFISECQCTPWMLVPFQSSKCQINQGKLVALSFTTFKIIWNNERFFILRNENMPSMLFRSWLYTQGCELYISPPAWPHLKKSLAGDFKQNCHLWREILGLGGRFAAKLRFHGWKTKKRQKIGRILAGDLGNLADWAGLREISHQLAGGGHAAAHLQPVPLRNDISPSLFSIDPSSFFFFFCCWHLSVFFFFF
jgi:hypothetical protein